MLHASRLGIDSHGVRLAIHYARVLRSGRVNPTPKMQIRRTYDRAFKLMEHGAVKVSRLIHEAMPVDELPRGLDSMKRGAAGMKLQVVW